MRPRPAHRAPLDVALTRVDAERARNVLIFFRDRTILNDEFFAPRRIPKRCGEVGDDRLRALPHCGGVAHPSPPAVRIITLLTDQLRAYGIQPMPVVIALLASRT